MNTPLLPRAAALCAAAALATAACSPGSPQGTAAVAGAGDPYYRSNRT
jgi:hypothetical protein